MLANLLIIEFQFDKYQQAEKDEKKALHTREVNSNHSDLWYYLLSKVKKAKSRLAIASYTGCLPLYGFVRYRSYEVVGLLEASPEASKMRSLSFARVVLDLRARVVLAPIK